jgi:hypothetical protein
MIHSRTNVLVNMERVEQMVEGFDVTTGRVLVYGENVPARVALTSSQPVRIAQLGLAIGAEWTVEVAVNNSDKFPLPGHRVQVKSACFPAAADPANQLVGKCLTVRDSQNRLGAARMMCSLTDTGDD